MLTRQQLSYTTHRRATVAAGRMRFVDLAL
jgi:hypothetical protein